MTTDNTEILNDGDAQMTLTNIEGDLDDINGKIEDVNYTEAVELVDEALEKLTAVRTYLNGKVT